MKKKFKLKGKAFKARLLKHLMNTYKDAIWGSAIPPQMKYLGRFCR